MEGEKAGAARVGGPGRSADKPEEKAAVGGEHGEAWVCDLDTKAGLGILRTRGDGADGMSL